MLFSKPFHLLVAVLFLFQAVLPANLLATTPPVAADQTTAGEQSNNPLSSLYAETTILADISVEMKALLGELHERYPEQFRLWQSLLATLQDSDPRKQELAEQAGTTETFLSLLMGYSTSFDTQQQQLLAQLEESGETPGPETNQVVVSLYTVLQYQEKISSYELLAQGQLQDIHLLARTISETAEQRKINEAIEAFETYRRQQIRQFITIREEFERVQSGFADLNQAEDETNFAPIRQEAAAYQKLATRLAAGQQEVVSGAGRDFLAQLEQIAANRQRDMEATLAAVSDGRQGTSWPLFYQPGAERKSSAQPDWSFTPERLLSVMSEMRTALTELADILRQRNALLLGSTFLQRDEMFWLAAHIELENLHLERLAEIIAATGEPVPQGDRDAYHKSMIQWEEFGLLKEDILAVEALILNELTVSLDDETFADDKSWQQVTALVQRQNNWRSGWAAVDASFAQVVDGFKTFQDEILQEKLQAIETLLADIDRSKKRLANQPDSPLAHFLVLIDEALAEQREETRRYSDLKAQTHRQEQDDPLFSSFFGIHNDRFFNDFKYMGFSLWEQQALMSNLTRIRAHLLALSSAGIKEHRQPLLILQVADQLGVIDHIDYDDSSCTVQLRSTSHTMVLTGCGREAPPELRSTASDLGSSRALTTGRMIRSLFCFATPAQAGFFKETANLGGYYWKQIRKNWVNYTVLGVVAVGAVVAAPVAVAAGATAATVATVTAGAATVFAGTKTALAAQITADSAIGASHYAIDQMDFSRSKYPWANKEYFNSTIDQVETIYNVAKVAEGLWKYKYPKVADGAKNAENAAKARQLGIAKQLQSNRSVIERCGQQVQKGSRHSKNLFKQLQQADSQRQLARAKTLDKFLTREAALSSEAKTQLASLTSNGTRLGQRMVDGIGVGPEAKSSVEGMLSWPTEEPVAGTTPDVQPPPDQDPGPQWGSVAHAGAALSHPDADRWPMESEYIGSLFGGWAPTATHITDAERESSARTGNALSQLNADRQRMETAYQGSQTQNQQQSADSMAQIERQRSTQMVDAIVGGVTSGVAQGIGTLGERIGQGAGRRIAQDTGLIDRHPKPSTPGQNSGDGGEGGQGPITGDCPAGTTYDPVSQACIRQDNTPKSYQGSWRASSTCAANYGSRGSGTCSWNGSAQITLHPGGRVSGSINGGSRFTFNEGGNFSGCGGGSASHSISGSHANGSFSATASNGARITGRYTDAAISGSTSGAGTNALSGGRSMSCRTSGSINLSR